jgi:hypothetical protein
LILSISVCLRITEEKNDMTTKDRRAERVQKCFYFYSVLFILRYIAKVAHFCDL